MSHSGVDCERMRDYDVVPTTRLRVETRKKLSIHSFIIVDVVIIIIIIIIIILLRARRPASTANAC
jgi:uncharacterized membrane protein YvbJ